MLVNVLIFAILVVLGVAIHFALKKAVLEKEVKEFKSRVEDASTDLKAEQERYRVLASRYKADVDGYETTQRNLKLSNEKLETQLKEYQTNPIKYLVPKHGENIALRLTSKETGEYKAFTYQGNNDITADMRLKSLDAVNRG